MTETRVTIILGAKDEASAVIGKVGNELQNFGTKADTIGGSLAKAQLGMTGLGQVGSAALAKINSALDETKKLLSIAKLGADEASKALANLKIDPNALTVPDKAVQSLDKWQEKFAYTMGAGLTIGFDKAKTLWSDFVDFTERQVAILGIALVVGISAAVVGAIYAATKGISFAIGLLTGESYKSANIDALIAINNEIKTLQENLPLTAAGASALNEALKAQGTTIAAYSATINGVSTSIHTNADELTRLGVKFKDQNGHYLATNVILQNAANVLAAYKEGWDRTSAATAIGMGSEKQIQAALAITAEKIQISKDRLIDYGLVIGDGMQEAVKKYEDSMRAFGRESDLTSQGFKRAIADNIMPLLTDLADFFREGFPTAVMAFRYSLATITSLFYGLKTVIYLVSESILGSVSAIGLTLGGVGEAAFKALKGDFTGAKDSLIKGWTDAKNRLGLIGDNIVEQARRNAAAMALAWAADNFGAGSAANEAKKTGKTFVPKPPEIKDVAETLSDYEKLVQEIAKLNAESEKRLTVGRELTTGEKKLADIVAMRATGEKDLSDAEMQSLKASLEHLDATEKLIKNNEKLVEVRKKLNEIVVNDKNVAADAIERMKFENSLIGRNAEQQDKLRSVFESQLDLRHKIAAIDKETRGLHDIGADNAEIAKLQAASAARIKLARDEAEALINIRVSHDADLQKKGATLGGAAVGRNIMAERAEAAEKEARDDYVRSISKIEDLDAIIAREEILKKLKADIAASDAAYADEERAIAVGREIREKEINERIANFQASETNFGATKLQFEQASLRLLDDKILNQQRGMEVNRANAALSRQIFTDEAAMELKKFQFKGGQLAYDNANLKLQQSMLEIGQQANDVQEQKLAGLEYQKTKSEEMIAFLEKEGVEEKRGLDNGKLKNLLEAESLRLAKEIDAIKNNSRVGDAAKAEIARIEAQRVAEAATLIAEKAQLTRWNEMLNSMDKSFHDSFLLLLNNGTNAWTAAMRGLGNSFKTLVMDTIYKELLKPLVLKLVISVAGMTGTTGLALAASNNLSGMLGGVLGTAGSAGSAMASTGDAGDSLSTVTTLLKTGYQAASNGFEAISNFFTGAGSEGINISATSDAASNIGATEGLGTAATYLGAAAAGFVIGKMISGGYSAFGGKSGNAAVIGGGAIGGTLGALGMIGAVGGPLGIIIGAAIGGLVNRVFGRKLTESGIQGTFGEQGFSGQNFTFEKGGLFRSDKTRTSPLDAAMDESLDSSYQQLKGSALVLGNVFKDTSKSLDDFSYSIKLNFLGLNADQSKALLTGELTKMGDAMASQVLSDIARAEMATAGVTDKLAADVEKYWKEFARSGESATETLTRLSGSLAGVNGWLGKMDMELFATTLSAGNLASKLVDLFGTMDKFSASVQKYISIYFTAAEKFAMGVKDITGTFAAFGLKVPGTLDEFRALVDAQDLATESGRATFAMLMNNSEAFAALYQSSGQLAIGGRTLMQAWLDQNSVLGVLTNSFDGSALAEANLATAARSRYQIELALIKQIDAALQSVHGMFANTMDEMKFATLDNEGKYNFLAAKQIQLEADLAMASDPAEIIRITALLNQNIRDGFMLLSDSDKKLRLDEFLALAADTEARAQAKLTAAKANVAANGSGANSAEQAVNNAITKAVALGIANGMALAMDKMDKSADKMLAAADTPVKVDQTVHVDVQVDVPANVEVGIA